MRTRQRTRHPGDQKAVVRFTAMLAARRRPAPWTGCGDVAVRMGERGRPLAEQQPVTDPLALVLIYPNTETARTGTLHCARARIPSAWTEPYRLLTHALAGRDLPPDIDLTT
ncbi:hypothetical protein [Streptomyces sp. NPDC056337]|uniref:hypothetical protein n=1 Tax=Streptomyces sp. NPDC056337 TaxID=3345787 RepID=UPI0035D88E89